MAAVQRSLFLLLVMSLCSLSTCQTYKYHYIGENKTWYDAQDYCRDKYTDLAVVENMADMNRLQNSTQKKGQAWIGLQSEPGKSAWHWSQPGVEYKGSETNWKNGSPDSGTCVAMHHDLKWRHYSCRNTFTCICYDDTKSSDKVYWSDVKMTQPECQTYCRENNMDMASGLAQLKDDELVSEIDSSEGTFWTGLFRDSWNWSDGSRFSFRHWNDQIFVNVPNSRKCAKTMLESGRWESDRCDVQKPFICYDKAILIKEEKTWSEALTYCRENHGDLVSITNHDEQRWVQEEAMGAQTRHVWVGMRYTCTMGLWFWVSDQLLHYNNWAHGGKSDKCDAAGAVDKGGQWFSRQEDEKLNFICTAKKLQMIVCGQS